MWSLLATFEIKVSITLETQRILLIFLLQLI